MQSDIETYITAISNRIIYGFTDKSSIYDGKAGNVLFHVSYAKYFKLPDERLFNNQIEELVTGYDNYDNIDIADGLISYYWILSHLSKSGYIDDFQTIAYSDINTALKNQAVKLFKAGKYDFFYGGLGIAYYLEYAQQCGGDIYCYDIIRAIESMIQCINPSGVKKIFHRPVNVNLGLAHGFASLLKFCMLTHHYPKCSVISSKCAYRIIETYQEFADNKHRNSFFGYTTLSKKSENSLLGWCYGDLGVSYILLQAGYYFADAALKDFAVNMLLQTTTRKDFTTTRTNDPGFCHGTSGIAYLYGKIYNLTEEPAFKNAQEYWIAQTLNYLSIQDGKIICGHGNQFIKNSDIGNSVLKGAAGIGLSLINFLKGDTCWDACFMLQDVPVKYPTL